MPSRLEGWGFLVGCSWWKRRVVPVDCKADC
jgi:hypothetical protein